MSRIFEVPTKPWDDYKLYNRQTITINPGVTVLTGCNGTGKSTLMRLMKEQLEREGIPVYLYDNFIDGGRTSMQMMLHSGKIKELATMACSSEGEKINQNIGQTTVRLGGFVRKNSNHDELWIMFDAIDSGYSIDNIVELKRDLLQTILKDCASRNQTVYIIISANSYEMVAGESCLDVWSGDYISFDNYDEYKKYIIKTRTRKDKRYV
jgi:hypothetical protein